MEAVGVITRLLKIKPSCFHFAGTKDKRAITTQLVTAFKVSADKLQKLNPRLRNMRLGNFESETSFTVCAVGPVNDGNINVDMCVIP